MCKNQEIFAVKTDLFTGRLLGSRVFYLFLLVYYLPLFQNIQLSTQHFYFYLDANCCNTKHFPSNLKMCSNSVG